MATQGQIVYRGDWDNGTSYGYIFNVLQTEVTYLNNLYITVNTPPMGTPPNQSNAWRAVRGVIEIRGSVTASNVPVGEYVTIPLAWDTPFVSGCDVILQSCETNGLYLPASLKGLPTITGCEINIFNQSGSAINDVTVFVIATGN